MNSGERRALRHYRLRGYRLLGANVRAGSYELDLVLRRGRRLVVAEVKEKGGSGFGEPLEMIDREKVQHLKTATRIWLAENPGASELELRMEAVGVSGRHVERVPLE